MQTARDLAISQGIDRAFENAEEEWKERYYSAAAEFLTNTEYFEGGEICRYCRRKNIGEPHHHNVWGSMLASLRKCDWAEKVGYVTPTTVQTHIGKVVYWRSLIFIPMEDEDA